MKIPDPKRLPSGSYFIRLRLGGRSVPICRPSRADCVRDARCIKAEYLAGKREVVEEGVTLREAIDRYLDSKSNALSPSTLRGYRMIQKGRFRGAMGRKLEKIAPQEWQGIVNAEAALCSPKTLRNAWAFVRTVIHAETGAYPPDVTLPALIPASRAYLRPNEILPFVDAVKGTKYAVPALLALSSMRLSEIAALRWEDIPEHPQFIRVSGAVVRSSDGYVRKRQNKNVSSARNVPILIPALAEAIDRDRQESGPVLPVSQNNFRLAVGRICAQNGLTVVTPHGLRHSFASLAYHLRLPELVTQEIGGWRDNQTMHKIYTHIAQEDIDRYQGCMADFYKNEKNAG